MGADDFADLFLVIVHLRGAFSVADTTDYGILRLIVNAPDRAEKVLRDVRNELVSLESARRDYGVAINPDTWEVDWEETQKLRAEAPPA